MSTKRLRSVVQSIGHHGVSGLCYVHPHLGELCGAAGHSSASLDLLTGEVLLDIEPPGPLASAASALSDRFRQILADERIDAAMLKHAVIEFQFQGRRYPAACLVSVETTEGRLIEDAVSSSGRRTEIVGNKAYLDRG